MKMVWYTVYIKYVQHACGDRCGQVTISNSARCIHTTYGIFPIIGKVHYSKVEYTIFDSEIVCLHMEQKQQGLHLNKIIN